jgi:hypothetical protein
MRIKGEAGNREDAIERCLSLMPDIDIPQKEEKGRRNRKNMIK